MAFESGLDYIVLLTLIRHHGLMRIIKSPSFIISILLSGILGIISLIILYNNVLASKAIEILIPIFITISGVFLTVSIAGLAIIISFYDFEYIDELKEAKAYDKLLGIFYISAIISSTCIMANVSTIFINLFVDDNILLSILVGVSVFTFLCSLFLVIMVLGITIKFGIYRGEGCSEENVEKMRRSI